MKIKYSLYFLKRFKKLNVRIRKSFNKKLSVFRNNPEDPQLGNHPLEREYIGYRSIDVTVDWRAVYKETEIAEEKIAYFVDIGTLNNYTEKQTD